MNNYPCLGCGQQPQILRGSQLGAAPKNLVTGLVLTAVAVGVVALLFRPKERGHL